VTTDDEVEYLTTHPVDADGVSAVALGTVGWAIAFVVLVVFFRSDLAAADASWWIWVCLVGMGLGLVGLWYVTRRREVYRRHARELRERESTL
jgi:hypothetical protein